MSEMELNSDNVVESVEARSSDEGPDVQDDWAKARIILLEDALERSYNKIRFLHGCLTRTDHRYEYPEMTADHLWEVKGLITIHRGCIHSRTYPDCEQCQSRNKRMERRAWALSVMETTREAKDSTAND